MRCRSLLLLIFTLVNVPVVRAEDDAAVRELVGKINESLTRIKDSLSDISDGVTSSSVDRISSAIEYAKQVALTARNLADKHPSEDPARTMAENYPTYAERFMRSATALLELKREHVRLSDTGLVRRCEDAERQLKDEIGRYLDRNDPEGTQKIPERAERIGAPIALELDDAERRKSSTSSWRSNAHDFSETHGGWADVRDRLYDGAERINLRWLQLLSDEHRVCDDIVKQKQHPAVLSALQKLSQNAETRGALYRELDESLERILRLVTDLHNTSGTSEIDSAISLSDTLSNTLGKLNYAKGSDNKANEISSKWPGIVEKYRESINALKRLRQYQNTLDRAPEQCGKRSNDLKDAIQKSSEGSGREAKRLAQEIADYVKDHLAKAEASKSELQSLRDNAKRFSPDDGKWRDIARAMQGSADALVSYWESALRKAHEQCDDLTLGLSSRLMAEGNGMAYSKDDRQISDCTENEKRPHQDDILAKCKGAGKKNCEDLRTPRDCGEIRERYNEARVCLDARQFIIKECFSRNSLTGHQDAIDQVITYMNACKTKLDACP